MSSRLQKRLANSVLKGWSWPESKRVKLAESRSRLLSLQCVWTPIGVLTSSCMSLVGVIWSSAKILSTFVCHEKAVLEQATWETAKGMEQGAFGEGS